MKELGIPHPMSERSSSQQHFVIEQDGEYEDSNGNSFNSSQNGDSGKDTSSNSSFRLFFLSPFGFSCLIGFLCLIIIGLTIALTIFVVLYMDTFPPYEICRTKTCTRTATLFIKTMDDSADPCEDFHQFACGNWVSDTAAVVSVAMYDHTTIMRDRILGRLRILTENITTNDADVLQQVKIMYDSCINTDKIESTGFGPLVEFLSELIPFEATKKGNGPSLARTLANIRRRTGQNYMIDLSVAPDYMNTSFNTILIDQPDVTLTKDTFDIDDNNNSSSKSNGGGDSEEADQETSILDDYERLLTNVLQKMNHSYGQNVRLIANMAANVKTIVEYDKLFAMALTDDTLRSKPKMNNQMTVRQLNLMFTHDDDDEDGFVHKEGSLIRMKRNKEAWKVSTKEKSHPTTTTVIAPRPLIFNWTEYLQVLFDDIDKIDEDTMVIVNDLGYIRSFAQLLKKTKKREDLDMYLAWQLIYSLGKDVSSDIRTLLDTFTMKVDGDESRPNRRTQCITLLDKTIPFALTHKYILKYVNRSVTEETHEMLRNLIKSFKDTVQNLDWMDENTKARAILKANHIRPFIGYPEWLTNSSALQDYYIGLQFSLEGSFFENMVTMLNWLSVKDLQAYRQLVDTTWSSDDDSPAEADAFYDDELNAITFPAGFLQNPFVGMGLHSIDYGALGSVIGHELTHGFDTEGRYSDEFGRLNSWWSMDTLENFLAKARCFVDQYSKYRVPQVASLMGKQNSINGRRTLAENIADNGGIREALAAYRLYVKDHGTEPRLPGLEKYTPEQLFFLAFAQSWCSYMSPTALMNMLLSNVHSPAKYRIIGPLSNFKDFSDIWTCKAGSKMNPMKKCVLW